MSLLKKQFAGTFLSNVGITLLNFLTGVMTARALNPSGRGETAAILIWSQTLGWLFALGFAEASTYLQSTNPKNGKRLVGTILLAVVTLGFIGTLFAEWILPTVMHAQDAKTILIARWYMVTITLVLAVETLKGIIAGDHDFAFMNGVRVMQPLLYAAAIVVLLVIHQATVITVLVCAAVSGAILVVACLTRIYHRIGVGLPSIDILKLGFSYGIRVHPGNLSDIANRRVDQLFMTALFTSTQFGYYSVAVNISQMTVNLLGNLCIIVFPAAARIGGPEGLNVVGRAIRIVAILGTVMTIGLMAIGPLLIRVIYGRAYDGSIAPLEILLPGGALMAIASIAASGLQSSNKPIKASIAQIAGAIVTILGLSLRIWLHHYTIAYAAVTATLAYATTCGLALFMLSKINGFSLAETFSGHAIVDEAKKLLHYSTSTINGSSAALSPIAETNAGPSVISQFVAFCMIAFVVALAISFGNSIPLGGYQLTIILAALIPALALAVFDSSYLLPYVLTMWVGGPEIRRIFEWSTGHYQEISPLSAIPLIVSLTLIIPIVRSKTSVNPRLKLAMNLLAFAMVYAGVVGMARNGMSLFFDAANYILPLMFVFYALRRQASESERDLWGTSLVTIAVAAAAYGWYQFITMPPWDAFWMNNEHLRSIGQPLPYEVRVYSSLNSPGPAGQFFAMALAASLVNKRWRGLFGWFGVVFISSALALTLVRTSWLTIATFVAVYALLTGTRTLFRLIVSVAAIATLLYFALPYLPGSDVITTRFSTLDNLNSDYSLSDRAQFSEAALAKCISNPLGTGLGSTGVGTRLDNGGNIGEEGVFDNGYLALLLTFGVPGFAGLCGFFYNLIRYLWHERMLNQLSQNVSSAAGLAALSGAFFGLFSGNCLTGASAVFIWFFVAMAVGARQPVRQLQLADPRILQSQSGAQRLLLKQRF